MKLKMVLKLLSKGFQMKTRFFAALIAAFSIVSIPNMVLAEDAPVEAPKAECKNPELEKAMAADGIKTVQLGDEEKKAMESNLGKPPGVVGDYDLFLAVRGEAGVLMMKQQGCIVQMAGPGDANTIMRILTPKADDGSI
jgi:hypothetical protein